MDLYRTTSLDEAAFLIARGHNAERVEPPPHQGGLAVFVFPDEEAIREAARAWQNRYNDPVTIDAARFADARQDCYKRVRAVG